MCNSPLVEYISRGSCFARSSVKCRNCNDNSSAQSALKDGTLYLATYVRLHRPPARNVSATPRRSDSPQCTNVDCFVKAVASSDTSLRNRFAAVFVISKSRISENCAETAICIGVRTASLRSVSLMHWMGGGDETSKESHLRLVSRNDLWKALLVILDAGVTGWMPIPLARSDTDVPFVA